ncbi:hypothetical protein [Fibrella arboris]|uniref:hypothetical protein n=1 Tax=Fibrella arboris TaxID=3242486 RepID=UPI003521D136
MDTMPNDMQIRLSHPMDDDHEANVPNGVLSLWLKNGVIEANIDDSTQPRQRVGTFAAAQYVELSVSVVLRPNTRLTVSVARRMSAGAPPILTRTDFQTPARTFLPITDLGRLGWQFYPPYWPTATAPTRPQVFKLFRAFMQQP